MRRTEVAIAGRTTCSTRTPDRANRCRKSRSSANRRSGLNPPAARNRSRSQNDMLARTRSTCFPISTSQNQPMSRTSRESAVTRTVAARTPRPRIPRMRAASVGGIDESLSRNSSVPPRAARPPRFLAAAMPGCSTSMIRMARPGCAAAKARATSAVRSVQAFATTTASRRPRGDGLVGDGRERAADVALFVPRRDHDRKVRRRSGSRLLSH